MMVLSFIVHLAGATMLLLYAVRMVQTGIERAFGPSFKRMVTAREQGRFQAAIAGLVLAVVLQSSAAVALLTSGFAASGAIGFAAGLSVVLGADLGSALVIQILSFRLDWLVPLLLATGGWFFVKSQSRSLKQAGRILLGIAFILLSLRLLRETMDPIRDSAFLPAIAAYLDRDFVTAFLVGAAIAFVMHSSVAAILMCVTFVTIGAIPVTAGVSLVLGANFGSAFLPLWLTRGMSPIARRIPLANLAIRGSGAILALLVMNLLPLLGYLDHIGPGQALVTVHLLFNMVLLVALPIVGSLEKPARTLMPDTVQPAGETPQLEAVSALDPAVKASPQLALSSLKREVLRMCQIVEMMVRPSIELYQTGAPDRIKSIRALGGNVSKALNGVRRYVATLPSETMKKPDARRARELTEYAINLDAASEIISRRLLSLAEAKAKKGVKFSAEGWEELRRMHERLIANMTLAFNVLVSEDIESARLLMEEKSEMTNMERNSRKKHLKRLREGTEVSFESSDIHLETLRSLKDLNSQIAAVAYPILYRHGQLLETRLVETIPEEDDAD